MVKEHCTLLCGMMLVALKDEDESAVCLFSSSGHVLTLVGESAGTIPTGNLLSLPVLPPLSLESHCYQLTYLQVGG